MVWLNQIVQGFALPDGDAFFFRFIGIARGQGRCVGTTFRWLRPPVHRDDKWPSERSAARLLHPVSRSARRQWSDPQYRPRGTEISTAL